MIGHVDDHGRALVTVLIKRQDAAAVYEVEAWIDTGFNGDLVLAQEQIDGFGLRQSGTVKATLADGSEIALKRYVCLIRWFDEEREVEVVANEGEYPLLGVGLLLEYDLHISYRSGGITIE